MKNYYNSMRSSWISNWKSTSCAVTTPTSWKSCATTWTKSTMYANTRSTCTSKSINGGDRMWCERVGVALRGYPVPALASLRPRDTANPQEWVCV